MGEQLRRARTVQARTLRQVADAAGVSIGHLSQVERGKAEASSEVLDALCRALGLDLAALLHAVLVDLATTSSGSSTRSRPHQQTSFTSHVQAMAA